MPLSCAATSTHKTPYGEAMGLDCLVQQGVLRALVGLEEVGVAGETDTAWWAGITVGHRRYLRGD